MEREFATAWALVEKSLKTGSQTGKQFLIGGLTEEFGIFAVGNGICDQGQDYMEEALEVYRRFQSFVFACQTLKWLGDAALGMGEFQKAEARYRESLAMTRDVGMLSFGVNVRLALGRAELRQGRVEPALESFAAALTVSREMMKPEFPAMTAFYVLDCLAAALAVQGNAEAAARLFGALDAQFEALLAKGYTRKRLFDAVGRQEHEHFLALCRDQLDEATFDRLLEEGRGLTLEEAVESGLGQARQLLAAPLSPRH